MTCDRWHIKPGVGWAFSQKFSCWAPTVCELWCFQDLKEKDEWLALSRSCLKNSLAGAGEEEEEAGAGEVEGEAGAGEVEGGGHGQEGGLIATLKSID